MKISLREWLIFIFLALLCFSLWYKFEYPQFIFVELSVDRKEALKIAESYLKNLGVRTKDYLQAIVFTTDDWSDRYLQKTIGIEQEEKFLQRHGYELFSWWVRFFRELKKEEYNITVSPRSGDVLSFTHLIEDIEPRSGIEKEIAKEKAEEFLKKTYGLNLEEYDFHEEKATRYEQRTDYSFSWEKKNVYIPWREKEGGAKLLIGATVSGNEIKGFYKARLDIPEKFQRYIENQLIFGDYLASFSLVLFLFLLMFSIITVIKSKNTIIMRFCKTWFFALTAFFLIINIINLVNNIQSIIIDYPTTTRLSLYLWLYLLRIVISIIFLSVVFILPGLAGESLRNEVLAENKYSSFLYYLRSTFYSRGVTKSIIFGYLLFFITLGLQAVIFHFGQRYLGVWKEWISFTQLSSTYLPFFSAFVIGFSASLVEEVIYRIFAISWLKKYLKNIILTVILVSLIWGFSHSRYAIFPVWFRGIEVSILGFLFGFIFIRYGIIPLIIAHYLLDAFYSTVAYVFGHTLRHLFVGSIFILALPLFFAIFAYLRNKEEKEREIKVILSPIQKYNLDILTNFISFKKAQGIDFKTIKAELIQNNWDIMLVDLAIAEVFRAENE